MLAPPKPAPWKESQNDMVLKRPVAARASLSAMSMASEPDGANSTFASGAGVISASLRASATAGSAVKRRGAKDNVSSCCLSAAISRGWP